MALSPQGRGALSTLLARIESDAVEISKLRSKFEGPAFEDLRDNDGDLAGRRRRRRREDTASGGRPIMRRGAAGEVMMLLKPLLEFLHVRAFRLALVAVLAALVAIGLPGALAAKVKKAGKGAKGAKSGKGKGEPTAGSSRGGKCEAPVDAGVDQLLHAGTLAFGRNPAASEDCYRRALKKDGTHVVAMYNIGLLFMNQVSPRPLQRAAAVRSARAAVVRRARPDAPRAAGPLRGGAAVL